MGGGDLNLKKSWHPSTMKNMEKVWKAEQKHEQEQKKIAELQREIREERAREEIRKYAEDQGVVEKKDNLKLDWMYKGPGGVVDREEYLLGRAVDKTFEQLQQAEKEEEKIQQRPSSSKTCIEYDCIPASIFSSASGNEQVDVGRKLQEDPLYVIKKKEIENRSRILSNPIKLKQIQKLLKEEKRRKEKKKSKKHKKRKKQKKSKYHSSSSESESRDSDGVSDKDLDKLLAAKYNKLKEKLNRNDIVDLKKKVQVSDSEDEDQSEKVHRKRRKRTYSSSSDGGAKSQRKPYGLVKTEGSKYLKQDYRDSRASPSRKRSRSRSFSPPRRKPPFGKPERNEKWVQPKREKLSEEEMERRRQEMMSNAVERDQERKQNIARYREEDSKDDKGKSYSKDFFRNQLTYAMSQESLEGRIKSKINNIQRSSFAMDKNFARR